MAVFRFELSLVSLEESMPFIYLVCLARTPPGNFEKTSILESRHHSINSLRMMGNDMNFGLRVESASCCY